MEMELAGFPSLLILVYISLVQGLSSHHEHPEPLQHAITIKQGPPHGVSATLVAAWQPFLKAFTDTKSVPLSSGKAVLKSQLSSFSYTSNTHVFLGSQQDVENVNSIRKLF